MRMARVGVLVDQEAKRRCHRYGINVFESYVGEVLGHAGIPFTWLKTVEEAAGSGVDILIAAVVGDGRETAEAMLAFAERGGTVISYAGLNCMANTLGCKEQPHVAVGYAQPERPPAAAPLRCVRSIPWKAGNGAASFAVQQSGQLRKDRPDGDPAGPLLMQFRVGRGRIDRWSVNIPLTIVTFQQGTGPVLGDGVPADDGTGDVDEGILKADDRVALDWTLDRARTETGAPYFAYPYADWWREQLIGHLLATATSLGLTLPFLGYWPDGVTCVATISHDSDLNIDESAETTLNTLAECGIRSTWCMLEPGYSPPIYDKIKKAGHELAFHYNALDAQGGRWDEGEFRRQYDWLKAAAGVAGVTSNKNHYTRFEGWGELFAWCERHGVQADQTRGPSKRGNVGFLFGTCHPYFPIAWFDEQNRIYDVLEIGFLTQDLDLPQWSDTSVIVPFLERVRQVEGVAHFLFHQVHIHRNPNVNRAIRQVVEEARRRGFAFWTSAEINDWERARRRVVITGVDEGGAVRAQGTDAADVVVWIPLPEHRSQDGAERKFGVPCRKVVLNAEKRGVELEGSR